MADQDSLSAAIATHVLWKSKMRDVVRAGKGVIAVPEADDCELSTLLPDEQCRILHQQFHHAAAEVLALAEAGERRAALEEMATGSSFAMSLSALGRALQASGTK
jgi:hypothetical protein